jgi:uncharacterized surface protein with fasciclin (FAS1) repeats
MVRYAPLITIESNERLLLHVVALPSNHFHLWFSHIIRSQFSRVLVALALLAGASAFAPATRLTRSMALNANIMETAASLKGPDMVWGSDGVALGYEESEVKGQDTFNTFIAAVNAAGLADTLSGPGPFTVLMPTDSAFEKVDVAGLLKDIPKLKDILTYHVVAGEVPKGSISGDLKTVNGKSLTYKRFARQTFVDDAVVGMVPQGAATGSVYPVDVKCDNGLIHVIDRVLTPGWVKISEEAGLGGIANK